MAKTERFEMRMPVDMLAALKTEATARCTSVAAIVLERLKAMAGAKTVTIGKPAMPGPGRKGGGKASKAPKITKAKAPTSSAGSRKKAEAHARKVHARQIMEAPVDAVATKTVPASEAHPRDLTANQRVVTEAIEREAKSLLPATMPVHTAFPVRAVAQRGGKAKR